MRRSRRADRLYLRARHPLACAQRIARHYRDAYGCDVEPERIVVTTGSSGGFILAFLAMFEPGDRVAVTVPGYPPYRHILTALGCEPVLIETTNETRHALTGEALLAAHRKTPLKGVLVGSPANPTGTMMSPRGARRPDRGGGRRGHPLHLGRDLSRARLRVSRGDGGGAVGPRARDQFVLEVFLHDGLARRLDGRARDRWCGRSSGCSRTCRSRCRRCRRSRPKRPSTARPRWRRSSTAIRKTGAS